MKKNDFQSCFLSIVTFKKNDFLLSGLVVAMGKVQAAMWIALLSILSYSFFLD